jgi:hypothetical protein
LVSLALDDGEAAFSVESSAARNSASKNVLLSMRPAQKPLRRRARSITGTETFQIKEPKLRAMQRVPGKRCDAGHRSRIWTIVSTWVLARLTVGDLSVADCARNVNTSSR